MHQPHWAEVRRFVPDSSKPRNHFCPIGVRAVAIDDLYAGMQRNILAKNVKNRLPLDYSPAESVFGLKANYEYGVSGIARALGKVVKDSPIFHHP